MGNISISEIQIVPVKPNNGLVAFASCVVNNSLYIGNIAIYTSLLISDNHNTRVTTNKIPVFFRGLVDYPGQGGLDGNRSTSKEINGISEEGKN